MTERGFDLAAASKQIEQGSGEGIPPLEKWNPEFCGDIDMRIARDGSWFYNGTPIGRPAMVKMFSRVLWQEAGQFFLKTPVEKVGIQVDDAPFLFIAVESRQGEQGPELVFSSKTDDVVVAGPDHPLRVEVDPDSEEPSPYLAVRFGMEGLIGRSVFYQLVELAEERVLDGVPHLMLQSQGEWFSLGNL